MNEFAAIARDLSGLSSSAALILILIGGFKGYWVWGRQLEQQRADFERQIAEKSKDLASWQAMALQATGHAELAVEIAKRATER